MWQAISGDGVPRADIRALLNDPRAEHLADDELDIGRWFADRDDRFHLGNGLVWDAFVLIDRDATFATMVDHVEASGSPIIAERDKLSAAFATIRT